MYKAYKDGKEISEHNNIEALKETVNALAKKSINVQFSIRDETIPISYPAMFTIKYFDECSLDSNRHDNGKLTVIKKGILKTECDYNKILVSCTNLGI